MSAKGRIGDLERDLADSRRREQELLVQIEHLTNAGAATPNPQTVIGPLLLVRNCHRCLPNTERSLKATVWMTCFRLRISPMP